MPIYQALQLARALKQRKPRPHNLRHGSDQILGGHVVSLLRREQTTLRQSRLLLGFEDRQEFTSGLSADFFQSIFRQLGFLFGLR